ncbi:MAG: membrane-bound lytic murein transglycosylase MltF [Gammaproteobacteria bacterium]|nr:membrane-bound lytic murein transglycosylase MltF [Gammaproteobacteria bacterium]MDH3447745.1 membrane-bound lytic murein transglycosylase MltF [Gammaproteobacteria bacterium]
MVELSPFAHRVQLISGLVAAAVVLAVMIVSPGIDSSALSTLDKIKQRGYINVLTLNSATTYYQDIDGPNGFEYQLASWFADSIGVKAHFVTVPNFADLYPELLFGSGDIVAAGLSDGESDFSRSVVYGPAYYQVTNQVLYRKFNADRPREVSELIGGSFKVIGGTAHARLLQDLHDQYPSLAWTEVDDIATEELIEEVDAGQVDYILADSHEIALQRRYFPELRIAFELGEPRKLRWAYNRGDSDSLGNAISMFFGEIEQDGRLEQLIHRHYSHVEKFNYSDIRTFTRRMRTHLPKYEELFKKAAAEVELDWRLLAAIGYQESLWNPRAKSPTGVRGLMMLTLNTAKQMKVKNRLDPAQSIRGGSKYIARVLKRFPEQIPEPDRSWLALAAYNVGFGHVEDARIITESRGGDPDRWIDVKESLPLLARKKWYKKTRYGYARGWEPVKYVENIRQYYEHLIGYETRALREASDIKPKQDVAPLAPSL